MSKSSSLISNNIYIYVCVCVSVCVCVCVYVCMCVTWFTIRDHFWQNIFDVVYQRTSVKKSQKTVLYAYSCYIFTIVHANCMYVYKTVFEEFLIVFFFHKTRPERSDRSDPLLQIRSHTHTHIYKIVLMYINDVIWIINIDFYVY